MKKKSEREDKKEEITEKKHLFANNCNKYELQVLGEKLGVKSFELFCFLLFLLRF